MFRADVSHSELKITLNVKKPAFLARTLQTQTLSFYAVRLFGLCG